MQIMLETGQQHFHPSAVKIVKAFLGDPCNEAEKKVGRPALSLSYSCLCVGDLCVYK